MYLTHITGLLTLFAIVQCEFYCENNYCLCTGTEIKCDDSAESEPVFTILERLFVKVLHMSGTQQDYIGRVCGLFPALDHVTLMTNKSCPSNGTTCTRVECM